MKLILKTLFRLSSSVCVLPFVGTHFVLGSISNLDASLETHSQIFSLIPGKLGNYLRVAFYQFALARCDSSACISFGVLFSKCNASVGKNVYIGPRCQLGSVTLEDDVLVGPNVQIPSGAQTHGIARFDIPIRLQPGKLRTLTIGQDSWIGAGCIILNDVAVQNVIGAGSVVTKPTQPSGIYCGSPAKRVRDRLESSE